jgi:hypothetical protein
MRPRGDDENRVTRRNGGCGDVGQALDQRFILAVKVNRMDY